MANMSLAIARLFVFLISFGSTGLWPDIHLQYRVIAHRHRRLSLDQNRPVFKQTNGASLERSHRPQYERSGRKPSHNNKCYCKIVISSGYFYLPNLKRHLLFVYCKHVGYHFSSNSHSYTVVISFSKFFVVNCRQLRAPTWSKFRCLYQYGLQVFVTFFLEIGPLLFLPALSDWALHKPQ